jgi:hypothetical protein
VVSVTDPYDRILGFLDQNYKSRALNIDKRVRHVYREFSFRYVACTTADVMWFLQ